MTARIVTRRLPLGTLKADPESLRRELARDRLRLNEENRWRTDPPKELVVDTAVTIGKADRIVLIDDDTAAGTVTVSLLTGDNRENGQTHVVKKLGTTGNVTIDPGSGNTIDGSSTHTLTAQYDVVTVIYSAEQDEWFILSTG